MGDERVGGLWTETRHPIGSSGVHIGHHHLNLWKVNTDLA
jgi:hypothetical protein